MVFSIAGLFLTYALSAAAGDPAAQSRRASAPSRRIWRSTRPRQLRHQYQLAELRRRDDDELPVADAGPGDAEFRLGGRGHGGAGGLDSRLGAPFGQDDRQLLGRSDAQRRSTSCCRCRSCCALVLVSQGVVQTFGRYQTVRAASSRRNGRRRQTGDRAGHCRGSGRIADRDQATRHQRRRILQRQLGPSVREPNAAVELPGDAGDPADPGGAVLHVRRDGRRHAAGLGRAGGDDVIFVAPWLSPWSRSSAATRR